MPVVGSKAYLITLNGNVLCVVFSTGYYALLIQDEMREEHFENIYGVPISAKTKVMEEQYETEYIWDYIEVDSLTPADAERRATAIMERKTKAE